jgi:hypothetical protein
VTTEEGVEAWIYKPLVLIEQEPLRSPSETPITLARSDITETAFAVAATPAVLVELQAANTPWEPAWDASSAAPIDASHILPHSIWTSWSIDTWLSHLRGSAAYVIIALAMVLVLSITVQRRSAKQLRQAMQEMGQILDVVEEIYARGVLARTRRSRVGALHPMPAGAPHQPPTRPGVELSPVEYAVLQSLSGQPQVEEKELEKILAAKGFTSVLIKAVIGDIVRKTGIVGVPWVEVRSVQGRCYYRLRVEARLNLNEQRSERHGERHAPHY